MAKVPFEMFQLRCFVTLAEELNFRRAATRLNMTQPPLSRQIKLLEEGIGLTLLQRDNRTVKLTPAGESFRASAIDLLSKAEQALLNARQAERGEVGTVSMGFVPSAALNFVPRIVSVLIRDMPSITFNPIEMVGFEIMEALITGQIDFGLTRSSHHGDGIVSIRVAREPFVLAIPAGHRLGKVEGLQARHLEGVPYIGYSTDRGGFLRDIHSALFATTGVSPRIVQEVSQTQTLLALVNVGLGVALVPGSAMTVQMENLEYRIIDLPDQFRPNLYLNIGPNSDAVMHSRIRDCILEAMRTG